MLVMLSGKHEWIAMRLANGEKSGDVADEGKDKAAQSLGKRGGHARANALSPRRRAEIASKAAKVRWAARASSPKQPRSRSSKESR